MPTIVGETKRHFRDRTWAVRPPRDLEEHALRLLRVIDELSETRGRSPTSRRDRRSDAVKRRGRARGAAGGRGPPGQVAAGPPGDDDGDPVLGGSGGSEDLGLDGAENRAPLAPLMRAVGPREREVLRLRFVEDMTQAEIAAVMGVSQMQISRRASRPGAPARGRAGRAAARTPAPCRA